MDRAATFVNSVLIILVSFGRVAVKGQVTASRSMCPRGWSEDSMRVVDIYARVSCIRSLSTSGSDQLRLTVARELSCVQYNLDIVL